MPLASGHDQAGQPVPKGLHRTMSAAYSLHTTPTEFAHLIRAIMQPQADNDSHLSTVMLHTMLAPYVQVNDSAPWHEDWPKAQITLDPNVAWGLGWGLQQGMPAPAFWHWGDNFTYTAFAIGFRDEGVGIVIMTNSRGGYDLFEPICRAAIGGDYPGLRWLERLFR